MHRSFDWLVKPLLSSQQGGAGSRGQEVQGRMVTGTGEWPQQQLLSQSWRVSHTHMGVHHRVRRNIREKYWSLETLSDASSDKQPLDAVSSCHCPLDSC